ncbi:MAG: dehydrogenase, partial [Acidobacteria bacterium]
MDRIAGKNWLAVGDAAAAFDPLSSQGIQSALTSGLRAAQSVERYLNGDRVALPSYASWVNKNFAEYLLIRNRFYRRELRWPRSLFWQRRQIEMPA